LKPSLLSRDATWTLPWGSDRFVVVRDPDFKLYCAGRPARVKVPMRISPPR
jgi:hypothetical protein